MFYSSDVRMAQYAQISVLHPTKKRSYKIYLRISVGTEKAPDKIQHPFLIKTLHEVALQGTYINTIKVIREKSTANTMLNGEKQKLFL